MRSPPQEVSQLLLAWRDGDESALEKLMPLVYAELRRLAHRHMNRERAGHTLQTTALVNEVYLRLADLKHIDWHDRAHFFAISASFMRRILVDWARAKAYAKRGGNPVRVSLGEEMGALENKGPDLVALDDALKDLEAMDPRKSRIVEMRFFGGLSLEETAEALAISIPTVEREWRSARAWLHKALTPTHGHES